MNLVPTPLVRRLVLGTALLLGLGAALPWKAAEVRAQTAAAPAAPSPADAAPAASAATSTPAPSAAAPAAPADSAATKGKGRGITARIELDDTDPADKAAASDPAPPREIVIEKNGKKVRITGAGPDRELDDLEKFAHKAPSVARTAVSIVAIIFLSPVLIVGLVIWYRIRKARMLNETMLRLAERGVVPPAEAMQALTAGQVPASVAGGATTSVSGAALATQVRDIRTRAAWSDLRKGVIAGAVGLGLTFFSMLDDGSPNALGLILLFVGVGYCVLWWFETRPATPSSGDAGSAGPST